MQLLIRPNSQRKGYAQISIVMDIFGWHIWDLYAIKTMEDAQGLDFREYVPSAGVRREQNHSKCNRRKSWG